MALRVRYLDPPCAELLGHLCAQLPPEVHLTPVGRDRTDNNCDVLVAGYTEREDIVQAPSLHTLIIPYSGLPPETRMLLLEFQHIAVHNLRYNSGPTAEMAIALLLSVVKNILPADRELRAQRWAMRMPLRMLHGATALVLGYGAVGRRVAELCSALGMRVMIIRRHADSFCTNKEVSGHELHGPSALDMLLPHADAVLICLPLTPETEGLIGAEQLRLLRPTAVLINVGRAHIVDEGALYSSLERRALFGAAMDVWYTEPMWSDGSSQVQPSRYPFHMLDNVVMSPHRAFRGAEAEVVRMNALARTLAIAAQGGPIPHPVNVQAGY